MIDEENDEVEALKIPLWAKAASLAREINNTSDETQLKTLEGKLNKILDQLAEIDRLYQEGRDTEVGHTGDDRPAQE